MTDLNDRQRTYLLAALEIDQHQERWHGQAFYRGDFDYSHRPASEWRAMPFGHILTLAGAYPTMLRKECGGADEGSSATWAALGQRDLLTVQDREVYQYPGQVLLHVTMTPKGRKLARELKGEPPRAKPKGILAHSTWKALAAAWTAGSAGLRDDGGGSYGHIPWDTWLILERYRVKGKATPLVEAFSIHEPMRLHHDPTHTVSVYFMRLTDKGRLMYVERYASHCAAYPDIEAPDPRKALR